MPANVLNNYLAGIAVAVGIVAFGLLTLGFYNWTRDRYGYGLPRRGGCIAWVLIVFGIVVLLTIIAALIMRPPSGY